MTSIKTEVDLFQDFYKKITRKDSCNLYGRALLGYHSRMSRKKSSWFGTKYLLLPKGNTVVDVLQFPYIITIYIRI